MVNELKYELDNFFDKAQEHELISHMNLQMNLK